MAKQKKAQQPVDTLSWSESIEEIEKILATIESGTVDLDELAPKVERAAALINSCRERVAGTELRVREALAVLEDNEEAQ